MVNLLLLLEEGPYRVAVDANLGGHIIEYSINGRNALAVNKPEIGSTFWPSPQSAWGWPPPYILDKAPYSVAKNEGEILIESAVCQQTGLQVVKRFQLQQGRLTVTYRMYNHGNVAVQYAPWEISRIAGGVTFYAGMLEPLPQSTGHVEHINGAYWHNYRPEQQTHHEKVFANGSTGWLANLNEGLLLVKQFEPVPAELTAPGEAEVEIYGHGDKYHTYIEIEQQGVYDVIPPGESLEWQVIWHLTEWHDDTVAPGSTRLVNEVKALLSQYRP
jgi:hypothetical protein